MLKYQACFLDRAFSDILDSYHCHPQQLIVLCKIINEFLMTNSIHAKVQKPLP